MDKESARTSATSLTLLEEKTELVYQPLPKTDDGFVFRVLTLHPWRKSADEPIYCTLKAHSLCPPPEYEALSYVWGDASILGPITVDGCRFMATKNAREALMRLRRKDSPRALWIDAICINQLDVEEKTHQVTIMWKIYQSSTRAIVWLGTQKQEWAEYTFNILWKLGKDHLEDETRDPSEDETTLARQQAADEEDATRFKNRKFNLIRKYGRQLIARDDWPKDLSPRTMRISAAIQHLMSLPWWGRIWIVQELALAPNARVLWSTAEIWWDDLANGLGKAFRENYLRYPHWTKAFGRLFPLSNLRNASRKYHETHGHVVTGLTFPAVPEEFRGCGATDPRDKLFALYGLAYKYQLESLGLHVDYATTASTLYKDVTKKLLEGDQFIRLLSMCQKDGPLRESIPSWVVDWSDSRDLGLNFFHEFHYQDEEPKMVWPHASKNENAQIQFHEDDIILEVKGRLWDTVSATCRPYRTPACEASATFIPSYFTRKFYVDESFEQAVRDTVVTMEEWIAFAFHDRTDGVPNPYGDADSLKVAFERTLNYAHYWDDTRCLEKHQYRLQDLQSLRVMYPAPDPARQGQGFKSPAKMVTDHIAFVKAVAQIGTQVDAPQKVHTERGTERCLFRSTTGYIGLCPQGTEPDDNVAVFQGLGTPMVLRADGVRWKIVGPCYVQGIMEGEAWDIAQCEKLLIS